MERLIDYFKKNSLEIAVSCAVFSFVFDLFSRSSEFTLTKIFGAIVLFTATHLREQERKQKLKQKGLTPGDINNISFVKDWETTRKTGIKRFCLVEGGLITGIILFIPLACITFFSIGLTIILAGFSNLLMAIAASLSSSYLTGVAIYYFRWKVNERRFIRLTDPLQNLVE